MVSVLGLNVGLIRPDVLALKISRLGPPIMETAFIVDDGARLNRPSVVFFDEIRGEGCIVLRDGCTIELTRYRM